MIRLRRQRRSEWAAYEAYLARERLTAERVAGVRQHWLAILWLSAIAVVATLVLLELLIAR